MFIHYFEGTDGPFVLELDPVPTALQESLNNLFAADAFWGDYRYTMHITGNAVTYPNHMQLLYARSENLVEQGRDTFTDPEAVLLRLKSAARNYVDPTTRYLAAAE